jgi:hypothetical protein
MSGGNSYRTLKEKHQQEVNAFPFFFAFNNEQFVTGMAKFGLTPDDTDKIYKLGSTGGFYLRTDAVKLHEMFNRHGREMQEAVDADTTGEGLIYDMFLCELANHEYTYTNDLEDTLNTLDLTPETVNESSALRHGLTKAIAELRRYDEENKE